MCTKTFAQSSELRAGAFTSITRGILDGHLVNQGLPSIVISLSLSKQVALRCETRNSNYAG